MKTTYVRTDDFLHVSDGRPHVVGDELMRHPGTVFHMTDDGQDIAALTIIGASAFLSLQQGYDQSSDTLTIGETVDDPALMSPLRRLCGALGNRPCPRRVPIPDWCFNPSRIRTPGPSY